MTDAPTGPRPFTSYTQADHARVAMAEAAWGTFIEAFRAIVPEENYPRGITDGAGPGALIRDALLVRQAADRLLTAAVVATYEQGQSWSDISLMLEVTKQSAHERFAAAVDAFRRDLAAQLAEMADAPDAGTRHLHPIDPDGRLLINTDWWAPRLDAWRAQVGELPSGEAGARAKRGELLAQLSDDPRPAAENS